MEQWSSQKHKVEEKAHGEKLTVGVGEVEAAGTDPD